MTEGVILLWVVGLIVILAIADVARDWNKPMKWYGRIPFVHSLPAEILTIHRGRDAAFEAFEELKTSTVFFRLGTQNIRGWATCDPANVEHILKTNFENYQIRPIRASFFDDFLGTGIFNADGQVWKVQRKTASYEFSQSRFRTFMMDVFVEHAKGLCEQLGKPAASGEKVDIQNLFSRYTLDSICKIAFGIDIGSLENGQTPFATSFDYCTRHVTVRGINPFWKLMRKYNIGGEKTFKERLTVIDSFIEDIITKRSALTTAQLEGETNLLSRFMLLGDVLEGVPQRKFIRDIIISFLLAGRDTTSNCLSWLFYSLTQNASVEQRLVEEIKAHVGMSEVPEFEAIRGMNYLQAVVSETLRLYPSVPDDAKCALKADVLPSGARVQPGDIVSYLPYAMGRRRELWGEDAMVFRPERWLNEDGEFVKQSPFKFTAFQAGPRLCLGIDMAQLEVKVAVISILQKYHVALHPQHTKVTYDMDLTLPVRGGLWVTLGPRKG